MKKWSLYLALLVTSYSYSQEKSISSATVPEIIRTYIRVHYPTVKKHQYYKEISDGNEIIECDFVLNNDTYSVKFQLDGTYVETERSLKFEELTPDIQTKILESLKSNFSKYKIISAEEILPSTAYEIKIRGKKGQNKGTFEVYFDKNGELIKIVEVINQAIPSLF